MEITTPVERTRTIRGWDAAMAVWVLACIGLALWTGVSVRRLQPVGETLIVSSRALEQTSAALDQIKGIPFVGDDVARVGRSIDETARSARSSGLEARAAIDSVSVTLAIAVFVIAVVPPVVGYLALRRRWVRERLDPLRSRR